jgi:phosphate transport system permease protein
MNSSTNSADMEKNLNQPMKPFSVHMNKDLQRRYRAERWIQRCGIAAIVIALSFLFLLFASIIGSGYSAFRQTFIELDVHFSEDLFRNENLAAADYPAITKTALRSAFPEVKDRRELRSLYMLISPGAAFTLQDMVKENPRLIGTRQEIWVPANDDVDMLIRAR